MSSASSYTGTILDLPHFVLSKISLAISDLLWFHSNFRIHSSSTESAIDISLVVVLNVYIALGNKDILIILIFPIHEYGIFFHLLSL